MTTPNRGTRQITLLTCIAVMTAITAACAPTREERCVELKDALETCIGTRVARLDCSTVSNADIDRLLDLTSGVSCGYLANAVPFDGDLLSTTCRMFEVGCVRAVTPVPTKTAARFPILLVNGFDTSPLFRYSDRIVDTLTEAGHSVHLATLTPYQPPWLRAPELWAHVRRVRDLTGASKVNLICHSLGGLDCRYLVSSNGLSADVGLEGQSEAVASITTLGTAHRGTRVADVMLGLVPDGDQGAAINDFATLVGDWFNERALNDDVHLRASLQAVTVAQTAIFNEEIEDARGVYYQSWGAFSRPFGEASRDHDVVAAELCRPDEAGSSAPLAVAGRQDYLAVPLIPMGQMLDDTGPAPTPNDGLIPVASMRWGNFRGCIPADHMEQLGQRNLPNANVRTGFDVARFYAHVASDLAARGF